jgi:hypothetical protein
MIPFQLSSILKLHIDIMYDGIRQWLPSDVNVATVRHFFTTNG